MGNGRVTVGLYNSYDANNFREPHRRAIARTGDIAMAYDMNLALFGFPVPEGCRTPIEIAEWIAGTTSIGRHGDYFVQLAESGRFSVFPYPSKGFPPQLGEPVLTTSRPDPSKNTSLGELTDMIKSGKSVLLVFGLGPKGVPRQAASISKYDIDITDGGYSLETCTAIGAVCGAVHAMLQYRS
ncbi:MAG: DUF531 domain-containing protein [Candidatus Methanomethylophilaceae archaeon]|jgi:hypothetical protein